MFSAYAQDMNSSQIAPSGVHHWMINDAPPADTVTGNWISIANFPLGPYGGINSAWVQADGKVFVAGGNDGFVGITNTYYYDPVANTYTPRAPIPLGRGYGKMVRVRDSLYLVGTVGAAFATPDGAIYRYHPGTNTWVTKTPMSAPLIQEMAVCVWRDSLIITICGSNSGFTGATNSVRVYNPWNDTWTTLAGTFPQTAMSSAATCFGDNIIVVGGYNGTFLNTTHKGVITPGSPISITWTNIGTTPFVGGSVPYRVGDGGVWNGFGLFGPSSGSTAQIGQIFGFNYSDNTWRRFLPNTISLAGNRQTMAVRQTADSVYFYLFGGYTTAGTDACERYAFKPTPPVGVHNPIGLVPGQLSISQNYPNPFNPATTIQFNMPKAGNVEVKVYDILGSEVAVLVNEFKQVGTHTINFDASGLSSGIYFYTMKSADFTATKKMLLVK
jgi:N-acetylneuraminic acid mutarotase